MLKQTMTRFIRILLLAAILAGTLDAIGATTYFLLSGRSHPENIWKFVASAVFGKEALAGGTKMVLIGLFFHYFIAFCFTLAFFLLYPRMRILSDNKWIAGICYGLLVWMVMNLVVVPMTGLRKIHFQFPRVLIDIGIIVIAIGLSISLMANYYYSYSRKPIGA
jgi:hypothetical protein